MSVKVSTYYSGDVFAIFIFALQENLSLYVEYLRKTDNVLRIMTVAPLRVEADYALVSDLEIRNSVKRLNYDRVFRLGIEEREVAA